MPKCRITSALVLALGVCPLPTLCAEDSARPNILWIIVDDMSANFSSYGETLIETPHVDSLASNGVRFSNAYVTAPVCSPNRSAFITGMYQTSIGAHHHRSGQGELKIHLPDGVRPIPELFQEAGYYTAITGWPNRDRRSVGKTHYNFEWDRAMYDGTDWSQRRSGQPFFAQIHLPGGKHRARTLESFDQISARVEKLLGSRTDRPRSSFRRTIPTIRCFEGIGPPTLIPFGSPTSSSVTSSIDSRTRATTRTRSFSS